MPYGVENYTTSGKKLAGVIYDEMKKELGDQKDAAHLSRMITHIWKTFLRIINDSNVDMGLVRQQLRVGIEAYKIEEAQKEAQTENDLQDDNELYDNHRKPTANKPTPPAPPPPPPPAPHVAPPPAPPTPPPPQPPAPPAPPSAATAGPAHRTGMKGVFAQLKQELKDERGGISGEDENEYSVNLSQETDEVQGRDGASVLSILSSDNNLISELPAILDENPALFHEAFALLAKEPTLLETEEAITAGLEVKMCDMFYDIYHNDIDQRNAVFTTIINNPAILTEHMPALLDIIDRSNLPIAVSKHIPTCNTVLASQLLASQHVEELGNHPVREIAEKHMDLLESCERGVIDASTVATANITRAADYLRMSVAQLTEPNAQGAITPEQELANLLTAKKF